MTSDRNQAESLRQRFSERLRPDLREAFERVVLTASREGHIYLVGGVIRDLLLDGVAPMLDIDLVTEADARKIARSAADGAPVTTHDRFLTATIELSANRIDLATARRESYAHPGALPDVTPATIDDDLRRRDFTMNALALPLDGQPVLIDPVGGGHDIEGRTVRVLHDRSFIDDATRIFRAFRYAERLGFAIEPHTRALIEEGVRYIETISGERLRHELLLLFDDDRGVHALEQLEAVGALSAIHEALRWSTHKTAVLEAPLGSAVERADVCFALLASDASRDQAEQIIERLQLSKTEADAVRGMSALASATDTLRRADAKPSGVAAVLDRYPPASIEAFASLTNDDVVRHLMRQYMENWRHERPILTGDDLLAMGIPEGPQVGRGLQLIRAARLDGWAQDRDDERALILRFAKSIRDSRAMNQPIDFKLNGD